MIDSKQVVCLASTMRSGSTLLKALLAEADDVSNLTEINFQKFSDSSDAKSRIETLDDRPIILLKRPAWYNETKTYPRLPQLPHLKVLLLVRDTYDTVESCRKMTFRAAHKIAAPMADHWISRKYWARITASLLKLNESGEFHTQLIRYEDLVANPLDETRKLFEFIGSKQREGVDSYSRPEDFKWRWGRDDGSPNIRSLKVQPPRIKAQTNQRLLKIMETDPEVIRLRKALNYQTSDTN